ncbi:hypothetical protein PCL_08101 [Purpureocillium lilacinum]|uniref:Uncharacterized protein n=1 Tax=Purpureocillium lilacinum TaxID=33203 RepID=A0A2U3EJV3_PURLI|nr:hypothetical protein Purlil1_3108 [Purpureocillium lilacinum]PWI74787.1 hypothetical protein PCL_08101 [Purpureocillium lilacinum]
MYRSRTGWSSARVRVCVMESRLNCLYRLRRLSRHFVPQKNLASLRRGMMSRAAFARIPPRIACTTVIPCLRPLPRFSPACFWKPNPPIALSDSCSLVRVVQSRRRLSPPPSSSDIAPAEPHRTRLCSEARAAAVFSSNNYARHLESLRSHRSKSPPTIAQARPPKRLCACHATSSTSPDSAELLATVAAESSRRLCLERLA